MPRAKATNGSKSPAVMMIATAPYGQPNENALVPSESRENIATVAQTVATRSSAAPMRSDRGRARQAAPDAARARLIAHGRRIIGRQTVTPSSAGVRAGRRVDRRPAPRRGRSRPVDRRRPPRLSSTTSGWAGDLDLRRKVSELIAELGGATFRSLGVGFALGLRFEDLGDTLALVGDPALGHLLLEPRQLGQTQGAFGLERLGRPSLLGDTRVRRGQLRFQLPPSSGSRLLELGRLALSSGGLFLGALELGLAFALHTNGFANAVDDARRIAMEVGVASHTHGLTIEQRLEVVGKRLAGREFGVLDQDRDHRRSALERVGDLHSHEVARHVDPRRPGGADHRQHGIDTGEMIGDHILEARPGRDRVDVAEHVGLAEDPDQLVVEAAVEVGVVGASVRHEDAHLAVAPGSAGSRPGRRHRRHDQTLRRSSRRS